VEEKKIPKVFISYSWTSSDHADRVKYLAERLSVEHIEVRIDIWDLREGHDVIGFMESMVTDPEIDKVLIIIDEEYVRKADSRSSGAGTEAMIMSSEIYNKQKQEKFIPILYTLGLDKKAVLPVFLKNRKYIDMSDDDKFERHFDQLIRNIHDLPLEKRPPIGDFPERILEENVSYQKIETIIRQIKLINSQDHARAEALFKSFTEEFIKILMQYSIVPGSANYEDEIEKSISEMKSIRDFYITFLDAIVSLGCDMADIIINFFCSIFNAIFVEGHVSSYSWPERDNFKFLIWEMYICTIAFLIYYEKYDEIHRVTHVTYFLRLNTNTDEIAANFTIFRPHMEAIESRLKQKKGSDKINLAASMLITREKMPILLKEKLIEADLLLCQLSYIFFYEKGSLSSDFWFPLTYIYQNGSLSIWKRLISKRYCEKVLPMYGVTNIDELKITIEKKDYESDLKYNGSFKRPDSIARTIDIKAIGTLP
jgi:hypothetical protein